MKQIIFLMLSGLLAANVSWAKTCSPADAEAADMAVDSLNSWTSVNQNRVKFGHCDDGDISEGISESVARLLADHWDTLPELGSQIRKAPALKKYVLRHIDSTLDTKDLDKIQNQAERFCPAKQEELCGEIKVAAKKAAEE
ncbi:MULTISPECIES: hypothetical protein [Kosakonia]|uniref:hypothetical protein n=1 Tax=Kosakonia TaxID=1330547 RepID=UPI0005ED8E13|nr:MULTISPECIES: hypothetical protein [Kosakonia]